MAVETVGHSTATAGVLVVDITPIFLPIKLVGHYFKPVWFEILKAGFHLGVPSGNLLHSY